MDEWLSVFAFQLLTLLFNLYFVLCRVRALDTVEQEGALTTASLNRMARNLALEMRLVVA